MAEVGHLWGPSWNEALTYKTPEAQRWGQDMGGGLYHLFQNEGRRVQQAECGVRTGHLLGRALEEVLPGPPAAPLSS